MPSKITSETRQMSGTRGDYFGRVQLTSYKDQELATQTLISVVTLMLITFIFLSSPRTFFSLPPDSGQHLLLDSIDRLLYTLKLQTGPTFIVGLAILQVIAFRAYFLVARNPLSGHKYLVEKPARMLANTVEQYVFYEGTILTFSVIAERPFLCLVPFTATTFVLGRVAFAVGTIFTQSFE